MKRLYTLKVKTKMHGGPYNGQFLYLSSPGTLTIKVGAFKGFYDFNNTWQAV